MPPKKASVNMKIGHNKKANSQNKADDIAPSGLNQNTTPAEQSLVGDGRVNDELRSHHGDTLPFAAGGNGIGDSILHHLRAQDDHINRLSNTVDELRKTVAEMKETLAKQRNESQQNHPSITDAPSGDKFDLVASVLKEIRSKDDQVERLKIKNDVLTLKLRYLEGKSSESNAGGQSDIMDDYVDESIDRSNRRAVKVPLKESDDGVQPNPRSQRSDTVERHQCPEVQVSVPTPRAQQAKRPLTSNVEAGTAAAEIEMEQARTKPPAKKPRLSSSKALAPKNQKAPATRGRPPGRTKTQAKTVTSVKPGATDDPGEQNEKSSPPDLPLRNVSSTSNFSTTSATKETDNQESTPVTGTQQKRRSARSATKQSRRPSVAPPPEQEQGQGQGQEPNEPTIPASDMSVGEDLRMDDPSSKEFHDEQERIQKESIAARDRLVEMAMQREEAMDMAEGVGRDH